jgi:hypothetical protein
MRKLGSNHAAFSGTGGASWVQGKMCLRPRKIRPSSRKATGRNATYPSRNRTTGRDHRAVVMRCTATSTTAAWEIETKKSQLTCSACHARASP